MAEQQSRAGFLADQTSNLLLRMTGGLLSLAWGKVEEQAQPTAEQLRRGERGLSDFTAAVEVKVMFKDQSLGTVGLVDRVYDHVHQMYALLPDVNAYSADAGIGNVWPLLLVLAEFSTLPGLPGPDQFKREELTTTKAGQPDDGPARNVPKERSQSLHDGV